MLKYLWACALAITTTLSAEPLGNIDFQFPPSKYEWKLLTDDTLIKNVISPCPADEFLEDFAVKVMIHREGDALEILYVIQTTDTGDFDEEEDEEDAIESKALIHRLFPNHEWMFSEIHEDLVTYGLYDGTTDLFHGYARNYERDNQATVLIYFTTALETEQNRALWLHALESATYLP